MPPSWSPLLVYFGITVILGLMDWTGLARAVRRRVPSPVLGMDASVKKGQLRLKLGARADLAAELMSLERQERRLESILKLSLSVETTPAPAA